MHRFAALLFGCRSSLYGTEMARSGWQFVRFLGVLIICIMSVALLATRNRSSFATDDLTTITDSVGSLRHRNSSAHRNAYQLDPPPERPPWGAVVAAGRSAEDLGWMAFLQLKYVIRTEDYHLQTSYFTLMSHRSVGRRSPIMWIMPITQILHYVYRRARATNQWSISALS